MSHPFKVIRGGQQQPTSIPKKFATFDNRKAAINRILASHFADRDKIARRLKAKYTNNQ